MASKGCIRYPVQDYRRDMSSQGVNGDEQGWVPQACTLPTVDRPLRVAELDGLFATAVRGQERVSATVLRWRLDPAAEAAARDLAARESTCCSFFTFTFTGSSDGTGDHDGLVLQVQVPPAYVEVLDALALRAAAAGAGPAA